VPRRLKLLEAEGLHRKKTLLGLVEIDRFFWKDKLLLRSLEVEMLSVNEALLLLFEQDRLHRNKAFFLGGGGAGFEPYK
jgi:hypothetical protein